MDCPYFDYFSCFPNKYTFTVKIIRDWVKGQCDGRVLNLFAGKTILTGVDEIRNDIDKESPADYHLDSYDFVEMWIKEAKPKFQTIILDPPYSLRKSMTKYQGRIVSNFSKIKKLLPEILEYEGKIITFGYHSVVMGKKNGFKVERIALFSHGGAIHDTIATIEKYCHHSTQINFKFNKHGG